MIEIGKKAPNFCLQNQNDEKIELKDFLNSKVLIWFFPKANTGGCTREGIGFKDDFNIFKKNNIKIIGVSKDSIKAQQNFCNKNDFPYDLLANPELDMIKSYEAWGLKKMYGKEYEGILRISYLIDEKGIIIRAFPKVKTATHSKDVLQSIDL